jgi:DNA polymerase-3 subunit chi
LRRRGGEERLRALDDLLWTYSDDSFLPHGLEADDGPHQPVVLIEHGGNPNGATVRFLVDGAPLPADAAAYLRLVIVFDGNDEEALATARERWREAKALGLDATYWQQSEAGRWEKRAG